MPGIWRALVGDTAAGIAPERPAKAAKLDSAPSAAPPSFAFNFG